MKVRVKNTHVGKTYGVFESKDDWARSLGYENLSQFYSDKALQNSGRHIVFEIVEDAKGDS